ncbi:MAG: serine protease [Marinibacterium sp.]
MTKLITWILSVFVVTIHALPGMAQTSRDLVWVQIEAHPSLRVAQERARRYSAEMPDVNGFSLGGSWYGVALGPYEPEDAVEVLRVYRAEGKIPGDSYVTASSTYGRQFWPLGANALNGNAAAAPPQTAIAQPAPAAPAQPVAQPDETRAEARRSERTLSAEDRKDLQRALQWSGFYSSGIDGAFGPGTRRSMADWQSANGYDSTGILTTRQRAVLMKQYNEPLTSVGLRRLVDLNAGIAMNLPMKKVAFKKYQAPLAHYDATTREGIRVLLISQAGDKSNLYGLYDILQTLEIVPLDGPRVRGRTRFTIEGQNSKIITHAEASIEDGEIKGFILSWPLGDERRRARVLDSMRQSFTRLPGTLDPLAGADEAQSVDLVAGLEVRRPSAVGSGFFVDPSGTVVTTATAVKSCGRITLDETFQADVLTVDDALDVAILKPREQLSPLEIARLAGQPPRLQSEVAVAGYSFGGVLGAPTLTFGTLADLQGLGGEAELTRLAMATRPGDAGGPVLDSGGSVVGMLLPARSGARQLPGDVRFAAKSQAIADLLDTAGLSASAGNADDTLPPGDLARIAEGMTVLVSCWN